MSERMARINRLLLTTLGQLVPGAVRDPRVRAVEVVGVQQVEASPDLRHARVYMSIHGDEQQQQGALEALQHAAGFLRRELGRQVNLRYTPELRFVLHRGGEAASRVEQILREVAEEHRMTELTLDEVAEQLDAAERILVTTHPDPDGDGIGSVVALSTALRRRGKTVVAFSPDPVPDMFCFLSGSELIVLTLPDEDFDLTVLVDCSDGRMFKEGFPERAQLGRVLVLDHHKTVGDVADLIYRDPRAAATGLLVYRLLRQLQVEIDMVLAEAIYCALMSDTGSFRYGNTNPEVLRAAAELLEIGVDPWRVASHLYENRPRRQLELLAKVLPTLQVSSDGKTTALTVTETMMQETGCTPDMVDGFINFARAVEGVEVGVLLRVSSASLRVSLRSRGGVDVSEMAAGYGGGGHHNAAGFTVAGDPGQILTQLFEQVSRRCEQHHHDHS